MPLFNENLWADESDCYSYAMNYNPYMFMPKGTDIRTQFKLCAVHLQVFPGCFSGLGFIYGKTADTFTSALAKDRLVFAGKSISEITSIPEGFYLVAAFYTPEKDFHFYRRDLDGLWSQKYGAIKPVKCDRNGQPVTDPTKAASYMPDLDFVGFFLMREPGYTLFPYRLDVMQRHKSGIVLPPAIMQLHPENQTPQPKAAMACGLT